MLRPNHDHNSSCPPPCHIEMLKHPERWPHWAKLPMKRTRNGGEIELATVVNDSPTSGKLLFYKGVNLWGEPPDDAKPVEMTAEEIVGAGWVVD